MDIMELTEIAKMILTVAEGFFLIYLIGYSTFIFVSIIVGSYRLYRDRRQKKIKDRLDIKYNIPVSILVPAYNEEVTVVDTVLSLLELQNNRYEIIVVDDGSKDDTLKVLVEYFHMHEVLKPSESRVPSKPVEAIYETFSQKVPITAVRKVNGGKADALNVGINAAHYDYFMCIDADSMLQYDSLSKITLPILERDNIAAIGGLVRISNDSDFKDGRVSKYRIPKNIFAAMQMIEYGKSFYASRILMDQFNGNLIISGAFGLFNRDLVVDAGGYATDTMGEDMELVMKLHVFCRKNHIDYRILYEPEAVCWTQAPEKAGDLVKQRRRWHIGMMQSMSKYRDMFMNMEFGAISFVSYWYFLLYELFSPVIEMVGTVVTILAIIFRLVNLPFMVFFFLMYAIFGQVLTLTVFFARIYVDDTRLGFKEVLRAIALCIMESFILRPIVSFARFMAMISYRKKGMHWGRIERKKQTVQGSQKGAGPVVGTNRDDGKK